LFFADEVGKKQQRDRHGAAPQAAEMRLRPQSITLFERYWGNPQSPALQSGKPLNFQDFAQISNRLLVGGKAAPFLGGGLVCAAKPHTPAPRPNV
jgi:hypothetical protein